MLRDLLQDQIIGLGRDTYLALSIPLVVAAFCTLSGGFCLGASLLALGVTAGLTMKSQSDMNDVVLSMLHSSSIVSSTTPEDKYGPAGFDGDGIVSSIPPRYMSDMHDFQYRIEFWNKETATAPAQEVFIRDTLDVQFADSTLNFLEFGFLQWEIPLNGGQYFNVDVDLRPVQNLIVNVEGDYSVDTRELSTTFRALDPVTRMLPDDPLSGFLPPITESGEEIGWVGYSVKPRSGLTSGTTLTNQAFVNFDGVGPWNPAPPNPDSDIPGLGPWLNTIDADPPSSWVVSATMQNETEMLVQWTGSDVGSGIVDYTIYAGTVTEQDTIFVPWLRNTTDTVGVFPGRADGDAYLFYSIARDRTGNLQENPSTPLFVRVSSEPKASAEFTYQLYQNYPNPFNPSTTLTFEVPVPTHVVIQVYDILGREVVRLVDDDHTPGRYQVKWEPKQLASGAYFYKMTAGDFEHSKMLVMVK